MQPCKPCMKLIINFATKVLFLMVDESASKYLKFYSRSTLLFTKKKLPETVFTVINLYINYKNDFRSAR